MKAINVENACYVVAGLILNLDARGSALKCMYPLKEYYHIALYKLKLK